MRLLDLSLFAPVFQPLSGVRVGLVDGVGNVGDRLIFAATRQLLDAFGVRWAPASPYDSPEADLLLLFGGGNMGSCYHREVALRDAALRWGVPTIVLPQSFMGPEEKPFHKVYVRERYSLAHCPRGILAPDLALGFDYQRPDAQTEREFGLFLRDDGEARFRGVPNDGNPKRFCRTPEEYLAFAGRFGHVATDILHFAICGLFNGRRVTLLPNSYHKNRGMWECWLRDLGCGWAETPAEAVAQREA